MKKVTAFSSQFF